MSSWMRPLGRFDPRWDEVDEGWEESHIDMANYKFGTWDETGSISAKQTIWVSKLVKPGDLRIIGKVSDDDHWPHTKLQPFSNETR
jgi:hypothetical protein